MRERASLRPAATLLAFLLALATPGTFAPPAGATENGARLFGFGPVSRAMGGTGIAHPQEAIGALTSNPAAACFRPRPDDPELGISGTFIPARADGRVTIDGQTFTGKSRPFVPIATLGFLTPVRETAEGSSRILAGFSIFGAGGFGADYRDTDLDQPSFFDLGDGRRSPLVVGEYSRFQALSIAPAIAFQPSAPLDWLAAGISLSATASSFDLRRGSSNGYSVGALVGLAFRPHDAVQVGVTYLTPQVSKFRNVLDVDGDGSADSIELELAQQVGVGVAVEPVEGMLVLEVDVKWLDWGNAEGFSTQEWKDQWVVAFGIQLKPTAALALRAGYNYGRNPVDRNDGFDGTQPVPFEGGVLPRYYQETSRLIGNPAFAEHHIALGVGYDVTAGLALHAGVVQVLSNTVREHGTDLFGRPAEIRSRVPYTLTFELGATFRF